MIETARLILRPWREADRAGFVAINNTPQMMEHLGGVQSIDRINAKFDRRVADQARHGHCFWAVLLREDEKIVGSCGVRVADDYDGTPVAGVRELGWRVAETHWGKGLAREAAEASIAWAWKNTDAPMLAAWTVEPNIRSWGLMERLGMTRRPDLAFRDPDGSTPDQELVVYTVDRP
jgi:RimJ/RimL family protein N-acetyltransferase